MPPSVPFAITPSAGSPLGGEWVVISGVPGGPGTTVTFGAVPAQSVDAPVGGPVRALTPPGAGPVQVVITSPTGAPQQAGFTYNELTLSVVRPDDLLCLDFQLINLQLDGDSLVRRDPAADALVVVTFPPQHIAEPDVNPTRGLVPPAPPEVSIMAGTSTLVFRLPPAVTRLPLTLPSLLDWGALTLVPAPGAAGSSQWPTGANVTALELPYRIRLTIDRAAGWQVTAPPPVPPAALTELWRATVQEPSLRVTWSPDLNFKAPLPTTSFASNNVGPPSAAYRAAIAGQAPALTSGDLTLSALGASVDLRAALDPAHGPANSPALDSWRQVIADGRDAYIRLVTSGYLAPWGHRASLVSITDREPQTAADGSALAGLTTRTTLVVTEPLVSYADQFPGPDGRHLPLPFTAVRLTTLSAPVDAPTGPAPTAPQVLLYTSAPNTEPQKVQFQLIATDHGGSDVHLTMPLVYVQGPPAAAGAQQALTAPASLSPQAAVGGLTTQAASAEQLAGALSQIGPVQLLNQAVNFIPPPAAAAGTAVVANAARLATSSMQFAAATAGAAASALPLPLPAICQALVALPGAEAVGAAGQAWQIAYHPTYLISGLVDNPAQLFAALPPAARPTLGLAAAAAGGLASPSFAVASLSQALGPVGNIDAALNGASQLVDPTAIFDDVEAKLLGNLKLTDFLDQLPVAGLLDQLPKLLRTPLPSGNGTRAAFDWAPKLKTSTFPSPPSPPVLTLNLATASLTLHGETTVYTDGTPPQALVRGQLTNPVLSFFEAVTLTLDALSFTAAAGQKADLSIGQLTIALTGDLAFLNPLVQALPADGFSDPPYVTSTPEGITAGFTAALPAIGVGILSIENLAVSAALSLPLAAPLGLRLALASREHPFLVTVSFIGGGGYFVIDVGADGIHQVEGSLEVAAQLDVDLLIVTASVSVMAGFYFLVTQAGTSFTGFVRIGGCVDLLGLISVSVDLYLALAYDKTPGATPAIVGSASLTVSVHVMFLTRSLTLSVQKSFPVPDSGNKPSAARSLAVAPPGPPSASPPGPPSLDSWMTLDEWQGYCQAFTGASA